MTVTPLHTKVFKDFDLKFNVPLNRYTSFRVGGPADALARPESVEALAALLEAAGSAQIPVTVLGGGTNTLVSDTGIRGLTVVMTALKGAPKPEKTDQGIRLTALAGERLGTLCRITADQGLSGLEWAAGIPGTLGGAIFMNAGAHGSDMAAVVTALDALDLDSLEIQSLTASELDFSYRRLTLGNRIILKAVLALVRSDPDRTRAEFQRSLKEKTASQPVSKASGGCFFKNPSPETPAGWLIEQAGLKGHRLRGAMVSDRHANFIINHDNAGCSDILALAELVRDRVRHRFNITLNTEVKIIGD